MSLTTGSLIAFITGCVLLALSLFVPLLFGGRQAWSEEDAAKLQQAGAQLHVAAYTATPGEEADHGHSHGNPDAPQVSLAEATATWDAQQQSLTQATNRGRGTALFLRVLGTLGIVAGGGLYLWARNASAS